MRETSSSVWYAVSVTPEASRAELWGSDTCPPVGGNAGGGRRP